MSDEQLRVILQAFFHRQPRFREFFIEFTSGHQINIRHREVLKEEKIGLWRYLAPNGQNVFFASASVCRVLDLGREELP